MGMSWRAIIAALKAANGQVFAAAQGGVVTGGFAASKNGSSQTVYQIIGGRN